MHQLDMNLIFRLNVEFHDMILRDFSKLLNQQCNEKIAICFFFCTCVLKAVVVILGQGRADN